AGLSPVQELFPGMGAGAARRIDFATHHSRLTPHQSGETIMKRVVVIGAGPAGSAAAMNLTRFRNVETLLLDRAAFPRRKVCGSALSPWALQLLDEMGVGPLIRKQAYPIHAGLIGGMHDTTVELRSHYEAAVLLRERFDTVLLHEAVRRVSRLPVCTYVK